MARYVAKNIVAADLAERCEVQLAYSIGVAEPVSVTINTFETGKLSDEELVNGVNQIFDLKPQGIIHSLDLKKPIYSKLAAYGHFGREGFPWEKIDKIDELKNQFKLEEINIG
jgi:S-adenosylmethionine synthetase